MRLFRRRGIEGELHRAVLADARVALLDQFPRRLGRRPPPGIPEGRPAAIVTPPGEPVVGVPGDAVAGAVQPIPRTRLGVGEGVLFSVDAVLHRGVGDRGAEVVLSADDAAHLVAQLRQVGGGLDGDLELGLLVFLHSEGPAGEVGVRRVDAVEAQGRAFLQREVESAAAELVQCHLTVQQLLALGVEDLHPLGARRGRLVGAVAVGAHPEFGAHLLAGTVDRPIEEEDGATAGPLARGLPVGAPPVHPGERHPVVAGAGKSDHLGSLAVVANLSRKEADAVLVGGSVAFAHVPVLALRLLVAPLLVALPELEVVHPRAGDRLARARVADVGERLALVVLLHDCQVLKQHQVAAAVPVVHGGLDEPAAAVLQRRGEACLRVAVRAVVLHDGVPLGDQAAQVLPVARLLLRMMYLQQRVGEVPQLGVVVLALGIAVSAHHVQHVLYEAAQVQRVGLEVDDLGVAVGDRESGGIASQLHAHLLDADLRLVDQRFLLAHRIQSVALGEEIPVPRILAQRLRVLLTRLEEEADRVLRLMRHRRPGELLHHRAEQADGVLVRRQLYHGQARAQEDQRFVVVQIVEVLLGDIPTVGVGAPIPPPGVAVQAVRPVAGARQHRPAVARKGGVVTGVASVLVLDLGQQELHLLAGRQVGRVTRRRGIPDRPALRVDGDALRPAAVVPRPVVSPSPAEAVELVHRVVLGVVVGPGIPPIAPALVVRAKARHRGDQVELGIEALLPERLIWSVGVLECWSAGVGRACPCLPAFRIAGAAGLPVSHSPTLPFSHSRSLGQE